MNKDKRKVLMDKCSMFKMGISKFETQGFDNDGISRLYCNSKDAHNYKDF